ncbi:MAG: sulfurtransferase-like selenium metabolism protein YedF [Proteobacteria bacterium]|nr:MAG: sulfurtransferase-like selenium metabolism protein YedF [Pseudomonadota bacterium]
MKLDCKNLDCPKPVIQTKKALENLGQEGILEVLVNSHASKENVIRFAKSQGCNVDVKENGDESILLITKGFMCEPNFSDKKTLFLKSDKIGEGELGSRLMLGFLSTLLEMESLPEKIICVNEAVRLTCENEESIKVLEKLVLKGIKLYSCGACLEYFGFSLQVGEIGDAYLVVQSLLDSKGAISL